MKRLLVLVGLLVGLSACSPTVRQTNTVVPLTGCNHASGWCDQIRQTAGETWLHAQIAANAYAGNPTFDLGPGLREVERKDNDDIGFAYLVVEHTRQDRPTEWIIAFRGTENHNLVDWIQGNALRRQNARGLAVYDAWRARLGPEARISLTGHSLGGGIASHVSMCRADVDTFVFNSSPRFRRCNGSMADNRRWSVVEKGEGLKLGRLFGLEATQKYTSINCIRGFGPIAQHGIGPLATCLTRIAAWSVPEARGSLLRNGYPLPEGLD